MSVVPLPIVMTSGPRATGDPIVDTIILVLMLIQLAVLIWMVFDLWHRG